MKKTNKILKQLSDLYEFNRKIKGFEVKSDEADNNKSEEKAKIHTKK